MNILSSQFTEVSVDESPLPVVNIEFDMTIDLEGQIVFFSGRIPLTESLPLVEYVWCYVDDSIQALVDKGQGYRKQKLNKERYLQLVSDVTNLKITELFTFEVLEELSKNADKRIRALKSAV
ncbi:hypothetical protein AB4455_07895 [Vibrio sp. 10N.261.46.E12]|uniref:hypothetical protein n=1 Tax=unclassified Vibrio TaxID=2614977 RepID=UPI000975AE5C|nr:MULTISPECIES: hypothetical protein [unclassified Vibrio]OMO34463.1 hypothetical protein BH584_12610 [Vibrio sp. 10N.261.45.E1]PMJ26214.1 hypothetical protein BCU27_09675 [Vibrio sp. 10N.286.45.B6]PML82792.1 hypothetical protein BCT66_20090 [Vibrio sp. 10N.261.49.E11]PMM90316.1 hypothetical protein BCT46_23515 [Vibrio sp. 10N.261.46.E8]PMN43936.1 hypothetical protein BCT32_00795 [Vibrio sp. 10N.261.45.E11]